MTVAICCVCPEGVVFGADSTASMMVPGKGYHYLNHNQKIFEIGEDSSFGIITWGLAGLPDLSYRTLIARLGDRLKISHPKKVLDVCQEWTNLFWNEYSATLDFKLLQALNLKTAHEPNSPVSTTMRTAAEEQAYEQLKFGLVVGFCIGGSNVDDRQPCAFEILFDPLSPKPTPDLIPMNDTRCWGVPKVFHRIVLGCDSDLAGSILQSSKWNGTQEELLALIGKHRLGLPNLPIRDAIDFVFSSVLSTIKAIKFSRLSQTCGGPIEVGVITSDRNFRWVCHKEWDTALKEGHSL